MANLVIAPGDVHPVLVLEQFTHPLGEAMSAGQYGRLNLTTGYHQLGNATNATEYGKQGGIALNSDVVGMAITFMKKGYLNVGSAALSGVAIGGLIYLSDTDGTLADTAGTVATAILGYVVPAFGSTTADKLIRVDITN